MINFNDESTKFLNEILITFFKPFPVFKMFPVFVWFLKREKKLTYDSLFLTFVTFGFHEKLTKTTNLKKSTRVLRIVKSRIWI